jgi:hypothetical protein
MRSSATRRKVLRCTDQCTIDIRRRVLRAFGSDATRDPRAQSGKWADSVDALPKYVGSNTLCGDLEWNASLLEGLEDSIPKLNDEVDGDLLMHGSGEFAYALAKKGLIDAYEVYLNPLWGEGNVHVLGERGTVRMVLDDVKRFDSGVVLSPSPGVLTAARRDPAGFENSRGNVYVQSLVRHRQLARLGARHR